MFTICLSLHGNKIKFPIRRDSGDFEFRATLKLYVCFAITEISFFGLIAIARSIASCFFGSRSITFLLENHRNQRRRQQPKQQTETTVDPSAKPSSLSLTHRNQAIFSNLEAGEKQVEKLGRYDFSFKSKPFSSPQAKEEKKADI